MTLARLALLLLAALALYVAADGRPAQEALRAPETALRAQAAPEWTRAPLDAPVRVLTPLSPAAEEEAAAFPAGLAVPSPLARPISKTLVGKGSDRRPRTGAAVSPLAAPVCSSPCVVDVSEWDVPTPEPVSVNGIASHMGRGFPSWYLALPQGPGFIARICGPGGCVTRTSTDAGPSKAMQRWPYYRVADLSVSDFERVCGCPASFGLVPVSVAIVGHR